MEIRKLKVTTVVKGVEVKPFIVVGPVLSIAEDSITIIYGDAEITIPDQCILESTVLDDDSGWSKEWLESIGFKDYVYKIN